MAVWRERERSGAAGGFEAAIYTPPQEEGCERESEVAAKWKMETKGKLYATLTISLPFI